MAQDKIKYTLPDFADSFQFNLVFVKLVKSNPVLLQDNVVIDSVYGCFPNCSLNGGRPFVREPYSHFLIEDTFSSFAKLGVKCRLTLTNMLARKGDFQDSYNIDILEAAQKYGAEAIVYSDMVRDYVKEHYGLKCVLSTTRLIDDIDEFNAMTRLYDYVVLNYNHGKDRTFIDAIKDKDKVEVMVNEYCALNCPRRQEHYLHNSEDQVNNVLRPYDCYANKIPVFLEHPSSDPVFFTDNEVVALHEETGIEYFKIVGRGIPFNVVLESYVYYLIKPEFREDVKTVILQSVR
jgi:hypothetical protein